MELTTETPRDYGTSSEQMVPDTEQDPTVEPLHVILYIIIGESVGKHRTSNLCSGGWGRGGPEK